MFAARRNRFGRRCPSCITGLATELFGLAPLMPTDEVVIFLFEGSEDQVRLAAQRAGVPFDRIVPTSAHVPIVPSGGTAT